MKGTKKGGTPPANSSIGGCYLSRMGPINESKKYQRARFPSLVNTFCLESDSDIAFGACLLVTFSFLRKRRTHPEGTIAGSSVGKKVLKSSIRSGL